MGEASTTTYASDAPLKDVGDDLSSTVLSFQAAPDAAPLPGVPVFRIGRHCIVKTAEFKYMGSVQGIDCSFGISTDVQRRVSLEYFALGKRCHL